jgi:glutamine amidotransferase/cyclase
MPVRLSCRALPSEANADWVLATSHYAEDFVAAVCKGNAMATQFHPEKSGVTGAEGAMSWQRA